MLRRKDLPDYFMYRGNRLAFHRLADGPSLGRLDPYASGEQAWPMLNGHEIAVTAEEIRDITFQVYGITLPPVDPRDVSQFEARIAALEAKLAATPEASEHPPAEPERAAPPEPDTRDEELEAALEAAATAQAEASRLRAELALRSEEPKLPDMGEKLSDWGDVFGAGVEPLSREAADAEATRILSNMADGFEVGDEISGLSSVRREELTQALYRKKGKMRRDRMTGSVPEVAEGEIDQLVGLLARRGV